MDSVEMPLSLTLSPLLRRGEKELGAAYTAPTERAGSLWPRGTSWEKLGRDRAEMLTLFVLLNPKADALLAVDQAVYLYNTRRPHTALGYRTPQAVHSLAA